MAGHGLDARWVHKNFLFFLRTLLYLSRSHGVMHDSTLDFDKFKSLWDLMKNSFIFKNAEVKTIKNIGKKIEKKGINITLYEVQH